MEYYKQSEHNPSKRSIFSGSGSYAGHSGSQSVNERGVFMIEPIQNKDKSKKVKNNKPMPKGKNYHKRPSQYPNQLKIVV